MQNTSKIILGIDPGTVVMGYGLLQADGNRLTMLCMGILKLPASQDHYAKLQTIQNCVNTLIAEYLPTQLAIEAPFFGKNVQSMLKLGRAQGVAIATAMQAGLSVHEYSPKKIKLSITGNGNADKEQLLKMLQHLLNFKETPKFLDASDAMAVALCHHYQNTSLLTSGKEKVKDWKAYLAKNPQKTK